jgi:hypothetical protein
MNGISSDSVADAAVAAAPANASNLIDGNFNDDALLLPRVAELLSTSGATCGEPLG